MNYLAVRSEKSRITKMPPPHTDNLTLDPDPDGGGGGGDCSHPRRDSRLRPREGAPPGPRGGLSDWPRRQPSRPPWAALQNPTSAGRAGLHAGAAF